jgi:hypothetical protein
VSGGLFEIGDDLPTLGADADRLALLKNPDLLAMVKLGRASVPLDLLTYRSEDEQPSVFLLREDQRQTVLAVFNWTEQTKAHLFSFSQLNLKSGHDYELHDALEPARRLSPDGNSIRLEQEAHSVRLIKIVDRSFPAAAPSVSLQVPTQAKVGEDIELVGAAVAEGVPALSYHWDFGDGTADDGRRTTHTYTAEGSYTIHLVVEGVDGVSAERSTSVLVSGTVSLPAPTRFKMEK